jgi:hypothetical protein
VYYMCILMDMIKRQNIESNIRWYPKTQNGRANNRMRTCREKARFQVAGTTRLGHFKAANPTFT